MKAGVKEGDRIIKVSDLPSPPPRRVCRVTVALARPAHFCFDTSCQLATELGGHTMRGSTVV